MKKYLVANVGETGKLYFIPEGDRYDGLFIDSGKMYLVSIFTFIARKKEVNPIKDTNRQKRFWKMDFNDPAWASRHFTKLNNQSSRNGYNERVRRTIDAIDEISESRKIRRTR